MKWRSQFRLALFVRECLTCCARGHTPPCFLCCCFLLVLVKVWLALAKLPSFDGYSYVTLQFLSDRELDDAETGTHAQELATYYSWMASPLKSSTVRSPPHSLRRCRQLELRRHVLCYNARFHLRARVETGCWQIHNRHWQMWVRPGWKQCPLFEVLRCPFLCPRLEICYLRSYLKKNSVLRSGSSVTPRDCCTPNRLLAWP